MMAAIRAFSKSWMAWILFAVLIVSFGLVFNVSDVFHAKISTDVVSAGQRRVSQLEFKQIFTRQLSQAAQQNGGQAISVQDAAAAGFDTSILQQLAEREAVLESIRRAGVQVSDALIGTELRKIPAFFNQITGAFDRRTYEALLANNQTTPAQFEKEVRDQIAQDHFLTGAFAGLKAPRTYAALIASYSLQGRSADYVVLTPAMVGAPPPPTDEDLTRFMQAHEAALKRPEIRQISLVRFSTAALEPAMPVDQAELQKRFAFVKDRLSTPEKRTFVQIPAKDAAQAAAMAARLAKGEDPGKVAADNGQKPISYAEATRNTVPDPKVADAAFGLAAGQVSPPIQGQFGVSVIKLAGITPAKPATLEQSRPELEKAVREDAAKEKASDQSTKYQDARDGGANMDKAAQAAGVQVYHLPAMTKDGRGGDGQPVQGLNEKMLAQAFTLPQGGETDVADLGQGEWYALRVDKVTPPAVPPLAEIRPQLAQVYMQQAMLDRLKTRATAISDQVKAGKPLAEAAGAPAQHLEKLSRAAAQQQQQQFGTEFLSALFGTKPGEVFIAPMPTGLAVGKVAQVQPGAIPDIVRLSEIGRGQLASQLAQTDFMQLLASAARREVKPKVDARLAKQAIGLTPEDTTPAGGKTPKPKS